MFAPSAATETTPRDGESPAARLTRLFEAHYEFLWRMLRRLGLPEAAADDGAQEVFVIAARRLNDIRVDAERSFLLGSAIRLASDVRKARARADARDGGDDALDALVDSAPDPEQSVGAKEARAILDAIIDAMPEDVRPVFVLAEIEGLSKSEIAAALDIPEGTVASRLRRAREVFEAKAARARAATRPRGGA